MTIDYDSWKTTPPEEFEISECPICEIDFYDCDCTVDDVKEYNEEEKAAYLFDRERDIIEEEDFNGEVEW